jgi:hypothetical protein
VRSDQGRTGLEPLGGAFGGHCAYNICEVVCTSWSWSVPGNSRRSNKERSQCEHLRTVETMETLIHQAVLAWHSGGRYCMRRTGGASYPFRLYSSTPLTLRLEGALFDSRQRTNARLVWTFPPTCRNCIIAALCGKNIRIIRTRPRNNHPQLCSLR